MSNLFDIVENFMLNIFSQLFSFNEFYCSW